MHKIIKRMMAKEPFRTPYYVIQSDQKGPTFIVTAGIHGTFPQKLYEKAGHPLAQALFSLLKFNYPAWVLDLHEANGLSLYL